MEKIENKDTTKSETAVKSQYSEDELATIFDDILFQGYYQEDIKLRGKLQISFRTRTADSTSEISRKLDALQYNLGTTYVEQRSLLNLASSLVSIDGEDLSKKTLEERLSTIGKLDAHLVSLLSKALVKFDSKIEEACKEGEENF